MSGRAVRRALRQREAELQTKTPEGEEEEASESDREPVHSPQKPSLFALLDIADEPDNQSEDDGEEDEPVREREPAKPEAAAKKSKNKKKKKKGKGKAGARAVKVKDDGEDDIDRALRQLDLASPGASTPSRAAPESSAGNTPLSSVLKIDSRNLDAGNEMKKLFGRDALRPAGEGEGDAAGRRRGGGGGGRLQLAPGVAGGRALNRGRKNTFVQPKDEWPNAGSGGLGMEIEGSDAATGITTYKFVHGRGYQGVQRQFMMCVASMDPQRLITLLQHNPYHITTLLQCSEIFHHQRDFTVAGDLLERALFSLGRSLHSSFQQKLSEGTARLLFCRPENRELFLCGWRYIKNLSQRGTWRTAEEFSRLLLAMDPDGDPYEMCLLVDFLALKAHQPGRLLALTEHPSLRKKYSDLPNIAFSSSLAHFQLGEEALATEYLAKAITKFPWIPSMLYQELNISATLPSVLWGVQPPEDNSRQKVLAKLYVERAKDIWKQPAFTKFLVDTSSTIRVLPRKSLLMSPSPEITLSLARHVVLTEIPALIALLPRSITTRETAAFDPIPPDDNLTSYNAEPDILPGVSRAMQMGLEGENESGFFTTFLRSILPWFSVGEEGVVDGRRLTEAERRQLAELRGELERAGVDVSEMVRMQEREEREEWEEDERARQAREDAPAPAERE